MENRLVLGTAQFGMDYGIANKTGKPSFEKSCAVVKAAWEGQIRYFDTAKGYGDSESILGRVLKELNIVSEVFIISKIPGLINRLSEKKILKGLEKSLKLLGLRRLYGLLLHEPKNLSSWSAKSDRTIKNIRKNGLAEKIGISVYDCNDARYALGCGIFDIVQLPFNIFNQDFHKQSLIKKAKQRKKELFLRSIFLQGLALLGVRELTPRLKRFSGYFRKRDILCRDFGLSRKELAIGYVKQRANGAYIIFGAQTPRQVSETVGIFRRVKIAAQVLRRIEADLASQDRMLINPVYWNDAG